MTPITSERAVPFKSFVRTDSCYLRPVHSPLGALHGCLQKVLHLCAEIAIMLGQGRYILLMSCRRFNSFLQLPSEAEKLAVKKIIIVRRHQYLYCRKHLQTQILKMKMKIKLFSVDEDITIKLGTEGTYSILESSLVYWNIS